MDKTDHTTTDGYVNTSEWMTTTQFQQRYPKVVCKATLLNWIHDGRLPAVRIGRRYLIRESDVPFIKQEISLSRQRRAFRAAMHGGG